MCATDYVVSPYTPTIATLLHMNEPPWRSLGHEHAGMLSRMRRSVIASTRWVEIALLHAADDVTLLCVPTLGATCLEGAVTAACLAGGGLVCSMTCRT